MCDHGGAVTSKVAIMAAISIAVSIALAIEANGTDEKGEASATAGKHTPTATTVEEQGSSGFTKSADAAIDGPPIPHASAIYYQEAKRKFAAAANDFHGGTAKFAAANYFHGGTANFAAAWHSTAKLAAANYSHGGGTAKFAAVWHSTAKFAAANYSQGGKAKFAAAWHSTAHRHCGDATGGGSTDP